MKSIFDADFIAISIPVLTRIPGTSPFDIYIRRAQHAFTKLVAKGDPIDRDRLRAYYQSKGVETLSVKKEDYQQYLLYAERVADACLNAPETVPAAEMTEIVHEMANLTLIEIFVNSNVDTRSVTHAADTVRGSIEMLSRDPAAFITLLKKMKQYPYLMKHSMATSVFSILLAKKAGMESDKTVLAIGLGGFLHDIGTTKLSFNPEATDQLTPEQMKELRFHPELGKRMLDSVRHMAPEVRLMVLQHHEQPNGNGYPNAIHDGEFYYPAKIVSIADSFSALITDRPYRKAFSPLKAIEIMMEDRGKFDKPLLDTFATILMPVKQP